MLYQNCEIVYELAKISLYFPYSEEEENTMSYEHIQLSWFIVLSVC